MVGARAARQVYARTEPAVRVAMERVWSGFAAADARAQRVLLDGLLWRCTTSQRAFASELIREVQHFDLVALLPPELALRTFLHLDARSLCRASQVRAPRDRRTRCGCSGADGTARDRVDHGAATAGDTGQPGVAAHRRRQPDLAAHVLAAPGAPLQKLRLGPPEPRAGPGARTRRRCCERAHGHRRV